MRICIIKNGIFISYCLFYHYDKCIKKIKNGQYLLFSFPKVWYYKFSLFKNTHTKVKHDTLVLLKNGKPF